MHYVEGFVFRNYRTEVALIQKKKPAFLFGKLTGIGGGVERGEAPAKAMTRETFEEGSLTTELDDWKPFATLNTVRQDRIDYFVADWFDGMGQLVAKTNEQVGWFALTNLKDLPVYKDLLYLVPAAKLALEFDNAQFPHLFVIQQGEPC